MCVLLLTLQMQLQPFRQPRANRQETVIALSQVTIFPSSPDWLTLCCVQVSLVALSTIALLQDHTSYSHQTSTGVAVFLTVLIAAVSAWLLGSWASRAYARRQRRRMGLQAEFEDEVPAAAATERGVVLGTRTTSSAAMPKGGALLRDPLLGDVVIDED